ncbi:MAG: hypothetical protein J5954_04775 [Prevotella sp.]|nr:hypothetical protein [Prevotella sp.]
MQSYSFFLKHKAFLVENDVNRKYDIYGHTGTEYSPYQISTVYQPANYPKLNETFEEESQTP